MPLSPESPHVPTEREIFAAAAALPAEQRAAYLDVVCAARPELRCRVEAWLGEHESNAFMETVVDGNRVNPEQAGERIGRYKLLQEIGEGGFGTVWMAEQMEPVSRRVALKIIKLGMDTREVIARFEQERQALAMMDHPNIAKVHDAGATQSGRPFFVMELVKGMPITQYCDEAGLGTRDRLALFGDVCSAINHAHQKGVIHRDIKPSNVMVTLYADKPVVKVIDFGIAKATQSKLTDKTLFTRFEQFIGTPVYMSPEQAAVSAVDIDTRSDIYALGVLLYELLTGKPPFDAKSLASAGYEEMRRIIREVEPVKPSTRLKEEQTAAAQTGSAKSAPRIPHSAIEPDLDWIVMKAIEKDRSRRYETANGLAQDIQRFLADEPVSATPPSAGYQFRKFARRNKVALRVAAVLVAATAVSTWQAVRATIAGKKTADTLVQVAAERDAKEQARADAEAISRFLGDVFQSPDPTRGGRDIKVRDLLDLAAKKSETDLAGQPDRRARVQAILGRTYCALGLAREAIPLLEKMRDYYLAASGPEAPDTLFAMQALANAFEDTGRGSEALRLREEVLRLRLKVGGRKHPDTLMAMNNLAFSLFDDGRREEALRLRDEVLLLCREVNGKEDPDTLWAMTNLANSFFEARRLEEALTLRKDVLDLRLKVSGPGSPDTLTAMNNMAVSLLHSGRQEEAQKLWEKTLERRLEVSGPKHSDTLMVMGNLANSYNATGRGDEAIKLLEDVLKLRSEVNGEDHSDTLMAMNNLAIFCYASGRRDEALRLREDALTLRRKVGPELPETIWAMNGLVGSRFAAGRVDEAIALQEEALTLGHRVLRPDHPYLAEAMQQMAEIYERTGKTAEAQAALKKLAILKGKAGDTTAPADLAPKEPPPKEAAPVPAAKDIKALEKALEKQLQSLPPSVPEPK